MSSLYRNESVVEEILATPCLSPWPSPAPEPPASEPVTGDAQERSPWDLVFSVMLAAGLCFSIYSAFHGSMFQPVISDIERHHWLRLLIRPAMLWGAMGTVLLAFRTILWFRYRPAPPATMYDAPFLTVIIPAYNEGAMVLNSINSVAAAQYPRERLEIIVVDDGSKDDTWQYIEMAAFRHPDLVVPIRLAKNSGKRVALANGFERARGEVIVSLDSDSVIDPGSLLALAGPFRNPNVGAVAGKVKVFNRKEGIIPRMLHVRYIIAFDFMRAAESGFRTVYCCPGALTAYRTSIVRQVLPQWLKQTFLGSSCTIGEDRAMTNFILAAGFDTVYQRSAVVHTLAPVSYSKLCRMFLRWDRSYIREELRFIRLVWKRPASSRFIAVTDRVVTNVRFPIYYTSLLLLLAFLPYHPMMVIRFLFVVGIAAGFNMLYYLRSEVSTDVWYGFLYSYFSLFALFWIFPFAFFTVRARGWMTR